MVKKLLATATVAFLFGAGAAEATPITLTPPALTATGNVTAIFVFADASDTSILNEVTPQSINQIFCNHPLTGCPQATVGEETNLFPPSQVGTIVFSLTNHDTGITFRTDQMGSDGDFHALISNNYSVYNEGALDPTVASEIAALQLGGQSVTFVGFEDVINGDYDYNDLIFAFAGTTSTPTGVPEPLTIALFGMGVAGAGFITYRRRRQTKTA